LPDLRKYASQTQNGLIIGLLVIVFTVGSGLIYIFYGKEAVIAGLVCLTGLLIPILLILLFLWVIERIVKK